jgi:hypothetical protein
VRVGILRLRSGQALEALSPRALCRWRQSQDQSQRPSDRSVRPTRAFAYFLFGEEVVEGFYGSEFVFFYVEDGVELGDLEDVLNFFGEAEKF